VAAFVRTRLNQFSRKLTFAATEINSIAARR
jgi:hypothetical protein